MKKTGGILSLTVTLTVKYVVLLDPSVALKTTLYVPTFVLLKV